MAKFSGPLVLTDLNDFIAPSQACIKPVEVDKSATPSDAVIEVESDGSYHEVGASGRKKLKTAQITLNDCLACSGCVTSAETVLIQMQSHEEVYKAIEANRVAQSEGKIDDVKVVVVSVSPQTRASLAAQYNLTPLQVAKRVTAFLKGLGVDYVFDTSFSRDISLIESQREFVEKFKSGSGTPLLASACPGWICYAEKTHGSYILPFISSTKSPQQVMGVLVKEYLGEKLGKLPNQVYHVAVMPCYDKKLEASREDFYNDVYKTRDVDCVITTGELEKMFMEKGCNISTAGEARLDTMFSKVRLENDEDMLLGTAGGGSGGYLEAIFKYAAKELFNVDVQKVEYKTMRNSDFKEVILEVEGKTVLKFAVAYGFRNIQNIVRKVKTRTNQYHYVEVMACPSGCLNGGGQLKPEGSDSAKEYLSRVEQVYESVPYADPALNDNVNEIYRDWLGAPYSETARTKLHTRYHAVEKTLTNPLAVQW